MKIQIKRITQKPRVSLNFLKLTIKNVLAALNLEECKIDFVFCDNSFIQNINRKYLNHNYPTDVIAFNLADSLDPNYCGEIVISVEKAKENSLLYKTSLAEEITLYIIHGLLHLIGYEDNTAKERKRMRNKEAYVLRKIKKHDSKR